MVIAYVMDLLAEMLSSNIRAEIFRLLFGVRDEELHMREIERRSGAAIGTIQALPIILGQEKRSDTECLDTCRSKGNIVEYD